MDNNGKKALSLLLAVASSPAFGQKIAGGYPTNAEIARVVNQYATEEFEYDPRMSAQRQLNYLGIPLEERIPGDKNGFLRKHAPEELRKGIPAGMDRRSAEVVHYGNYALAGIDPGPLREFVEEMDRDGLHGFDAMFSVMYRRLHWMVEDYPPLGKKLSTEERNKFEKLRRDEAIIRAWECEHYRQMRRHAANRENRSLQMKPNQKVQRHGAGIKKFK